MRPSAGHEKVLVEGSKGGKQCYPVTEYLVEFPPILIQKVDNNLMNEGLQGLLSTHFDRVFQEIYILRKLLIGKQT